MKLLIPSYFYPGQIWDTLLASNLDAISDVIINPNSGPGVFDPEYLKLCTRLRKSGVSILGYVSTRWGERPRTEISKDIDAYASWYGVSSMFLDEVATGEDMLAFYQALYDSIHGKVVLNPGVVPHVGYLDVGDVLVVFESEVAKLKGLKMPQWVNEHRSKICQIVINCPAKDMPFAMTKVSANARYAYITHDVEPNPYDELPKYWKELLKAVNK